MTAEQQCLFRWFLILVVISSDNRALETVWFFWDTMLLCRWGEFRKETLHNDMFWIPSPYLYYPSFCSLCWGEQAYPQPLVTGWGSPLLLFLPSSHQLTGTRAGTWPRAITLLWGELVQKLLPWQREAGPMMISLLDLSWGVSRKLNCSHWIHSLKMHGEPQGRVVPMKSHKQVS